MKLFRFLILLPLGLSIVTGCVSPAERQRQVERQERIDQKKYAAIKSTLRNRRAGLGRDTFLYRGRKGWPVVYEFVNRIGGTLVERGNAVYTIDIDSDSDRVKRGVYVQNVVAKIIDNQGDSGREVVMAGSSNGICYRSNSCDQYIKAALLKMR
jgi:hypothetical protein